MGNFYIKINIIKIINIINIIKIIKIIKGSLNFQRFLRR